MDKNSWRRILWLIADSSVWAVAVFAAFNVILGFFSPHFDGNRLWISLATFPGSSALLMLFAISATAYRWLGQSGKLAARSAVACAGAYCSIDAGIYYVLLVRGDIRSSLPLPLSLVLACLLLLWYACAATTDKQLTLRRACFRGVAIGTAALLLLLTQITTFGSTDYRRNACAIVVLGAGVYSDGSPSNALYDRTRTACLLYMQGYADRLVFSGGKDERAPISEPEAMRRIAVAMGVPPQAIILDEHGINTLATVRNVAVLANDNGWCRLLMVSHDYHLSRIKLLCRRKGLKAYTVPADETYYLAAKPYYIARELAAWGYYYLHL